MARVTKCWYETVCSEYADNCEHNCIRYLEMKYLMDTSNLPKARQMPDRLTAEECDFDAFEQLNDIKVGVKNFVAEGKSLYICSSITGNGKTSWAIKIMLRFFNDIWAGNGFNRRAVFIHTPTFLLKCKDFNNKDAEFEQMKKDLLTVDLVVWDDITAVNPSAYDLSQMLVYIDARANAGLSNIYTGNYSNMQSLAKVVGQRLASRIFSYDTTVIELKGGDKR